MRFRAVTIPIGFEVVRPMAVVGPMRRALRLTATPIFALILGSACGTGGSWSDALQRRITRAEVAPSTSGSPALPWTPPNDAVPHDLPAFTAHLPPDMTPGSTITLAQIIDVSLANNPATRTAWLQARAAQAALGSTRSDYFPDVSVAASLSRSASATGGVNGTPSSSTQARLTPSLSLSYLLFDFGGRDAAVEQSRQTLIAADYRHNQAIQDVILLAQQIYYDSLNAKALRNAQEATIKERETGLAVADGRHAAGVATIGDVLQARTALSQARLTYETIEGNLHALEGELATVMGLPPPAQFDIGQLPPDVPSNELMQRVDQFIAQAAASRPELAAQRALAQRAEARVRAVRARGRPTVSLDGSAGASVRIGRGGGATYPHSTAISLRVPLFTGGRNTWDIREAQLGADIALENVRNTQQQIYLQVWTSYYRLQTATKRIAGTRDLLNDARQSVDVSSGRYKAGVGSILDVLTAQATLENARALEVQARADWFLAVAQLAHDTGTLEPATEDGR